MRQIYAAVLWLYPAEYRNTFTGEVMATLEQTTQQQRTKGKLSYLKRASRELAGLLGGAVAERFARWTSPAAYLAPTCAGQADVELPCTVAEAETRVQQLLRSMEFAIAHHDFPKARFYAYEEQKARTVLNQLLSH